MAGTEERTRVWAALRAIAVPIERRTTADAEHIAWALSDSAGSLIDAAIQQRVGPLLADESDRLGTPLTAALREAREEARFAAASSAAITRRITEVFDQDGLGWVMVKGPILAAHYREPRSRPFNDLDLLVDGHDLGRAIELLSDLGLEDINRNWGNYLRHRVAETPMWSPGLAIDVHWHVIGLGSVRRHFAIDTAELLARRRRVDLDGFAVPTLEPTDLLLHTCLHAALSGGTRLGWLVDIERLIGSEPARWPDVVERAHQMGIAALTGQMLDRARRMLEAGVPREVPEALCAPSLLSVRRRIDARSAGDRLPEHFARGAIVRISREDVPATVRAVGSLALSRLRRTSWNVGDERSPLYWGRPSGGPQARTQYLAMAEAESRRRARPDS